MKTIVRGQRWEDEIHVDPADLAKSEDVLDDWLTWDWKIRLDASRFGGAADLDDVQAAHRAEDDGKLQLRFVLTAAQTADLDGAGTDRFHYDVVAYDGGDSMGVFQRGRVRVESVAGAVQ